MSRRQSYLQFCTVCTILLVGVEAFSVPGPFTFKQCSLRQDFGSSIHLGRLDMGNVMAPKSSSFNFVARHFGASRSSHHAHGDKARDMLTSVADEQDNCPPDSEIGILEKSIAKLEAEILVQKAQLQRAREQRPRARSETPSERHHAAHSRSAQMQPQVVQALLELEDLINVVDALGSSPSNGGCPWTWSQVGMHAAIPMLNL